MAPTWMSSVCSPPCLATNCHIIKRWPALCFWALGPLPQHPIFEGGNFGTIDVRRSCIPGSHISVFTCWGSLLHNFKKWHLSSTRVVLIRSLTCRWCFSFGVPRGSYDVIFGFRLFFCWSFRLCYALFSYVAFVCWLISWATFWIPLLVMKWSSHYGLKKEVFSWSN